MDFFVWEFAVVAAAAPSLVFALTYCVYMYSTLVIFVVEWHSMTRHQRSSGSVWLDFPVSNPHTHLGRLLAVSRSTNISLMMRSEFAIGWRRLSFFFRRLPSNLAVQRRRRQAVKETRKPLIYLLRHPPFYIVYVCGLYRGRRRTI